MNEPEQTQTKPEVEPTSLAASYAALNLSERIRRAKMFGEWREIFASGASIKVGDRVLVSPKTCYEIPFIGVVIHEYADKSFGVIPAPVNPVHVVDADRCTRITTLGS